MIKYRNILSDIIQGKQNWTDLKPELSKYNIDNREAGIKDTSAGLIFEVFAKYYFLTAPEIDGLYSDIWLYDEIPINIKAKFDLGTVEHGIDLLLKTIDDKYIAVQCKFKNDETSKLNWSSDKISNLFGYCPKADGYIVFSNCSSLDKVSLSRQENFTFISIGHLLEIEANTFININLLLNNSQSKEKIFFDPKPHQQRAIDECVKWFTVGEKSKGQLILPCGAGKTFTALWIKEELKTSKTLVLVPSLALLRQIKNEWSKQRKTNYQYLCVCSERDIDKDNTDSIVTYTYEIGGNVITEPKEILSFLNQDLNEKVIFSTYQSLPRIIESIQNTEIIFDFVFCDEAHKTAGISKVVFGLVHDNVKIPAKRRLYATATPRIVKESLKKKLGDDLKYTHDMNDPEKFGKELYRMSFKDAIEEDILVDYKIVAIGVNDSKLATDIQERKFIDNNISLDELANNYALDIVMNKYSANHGLTFHSRVKLAKEFASRHSKLFEKTTSFSVDGTQSTSIRNQILNEFKNSNKAIISNARCLTEGVDVPTIDLVYFSDPKNSKVDIIQAVGRALRKKEGKKRGYIVVPIYHTENDKVENAISQSSFKNLLQVIRSLCEQDERLQDEINSIAFGKGKRVSKKIDIISSFDEEIDSLHLIGFEEKLRESLFDQIIYTTSNNWDIWFLELKSYIESNNDYPNKSDNKDLYTWISQQRNRRKNGSLKSVEIQKLNSIDFAWNNVDSKWNKNFEEFENYSKTNVFPPCKGIDSDELVNWYKYIHAKVKARESLSPEKINIFIEINEKFKGPADRKLWIPIYKDLINWQDENSNNWPQYDRANVKSRESKLYVFCKDIRANYRKNNLGTYWFDKMSEIDFNFERKKDTWTEKYNKIKLLLENRESISPQEIGINKYNWICNNKKKFENNKLKSDQFKKIKELNLDRYFQIWEQKFEKLKNWFIEHNKLPTKTTQKDFYSWLGYQRIVFKNGNLTEEQVQKLASIGFEIESKGIEKFKQNWLNQFNSYKNFQAKYNKEPSSTSTDNNEKSLYIWVQAQRAVMAGSAKNRKPLSQKRQDLLNSIGFNWVGGVANQTWEESFKEFSSNINIDGYLSITSTINGKRNPIYGWWAKQKYDFKNNELQIERIKAFKDIGIDLSNLKSSGRNGFTKWANKIKEIALFKENQGYYPKAGKDKEQENLYQSLARTKRAYQNKELSSEQIQLLNELNIEL
jgi:superfamily II DNA or RNA helicase